MKDGISMSKPVIHDATPSWNGFNYQGKAGLYVCLCLIRDNFKSAAGNEKEDAHKSLANYKLEFEWIEDFSIIKNEEYISIHQVKHYNNSTFSSYTAALETILSRKNGIFSAPDISPFLNFPKEKNLDPKIDAIIKALLKANILSSDQKLTTDWQKKIALLDNDYQVTALDALNSFESLHKRAYGTNIPVYLHTSKIIGSPQKKLDGYAWTLESTKRFLKDVESFSDLNIHIKDSDLASYHLTRDDIELESSICSLIIEIRGYINPTSVDLNGKNSIECYLAALLLEIDRHVVSRHRRFITKSIEKDTTILSADYLLKFSSLIEIISKEIHEHDNDFFALRAKLTLDKSVLARLLELDEAILKCNQYGINATELGNQRERLDQYRQDIISKITPTELLNHLEKSSPHLSKSTPYDIYYSSLTQPNTITGTLLSFISLLTQNINNFFATCPMSEKYSPSCIDVSASPLPPELAHNEVALKIMAACDQSAYANSLLYDFHYIAIKAKDNSEIPYPIEPPKFNTVLSDDSKPELPVFHQKKRTQLLHFSAAAKRINGEKC